MYKSQLCRFGRSRYVSRVLLKEICTLSVNIFICLRKISGFVPSTFFVLLLVTMKSLKTFWKKMLASNKPSKLKQERSNVKDAEAVENSEQKEVDMQNEYDSTKATSNHFEDCVDDHSLPLYGPDSVPDKPNTGCANNSNTHNSTRVSTGKAIFGDLSTSPKQSTSAQSGLLGGVGINLIEAMTSLHTMGKQQYLHPSASISGSCSPALHDDSDDSDPNDDETDRAEEEEGKLQQVEFDLFMGLPHQRDPSVCMITHNPYTKYCIATLSVFISYVLQLSC